MNFDDLKSAWNKDTSTNITVPSKIEELKRAELPLDKIKKNMRNEFLLQVPSVILLGFLPQILHFKSTLYMPFYAMYILLIITTIYFFVRFYFFYKRIGKINLNTKDALYEVNYDIKLNMELYKMFCYMLSPFLFVLYALYVINSEYELFINMIQTGISSFYFYLFFIIGTIATITFLHFLTFYWLKFYYSKYAIEVENILKELKEE